MLSFFVSPAALFAQTTYNIMPLGNSVTRGITGSTIGGYRGTLQNLLETSGYTIGPGNDIDFVGSQTDPDTPSSSIPDVDHEGHSGYTTLDIISGISTWLTDNPPDMVLLHIGTNDLEAPRTPSDIANSLNTILGDIDTQDPNIIVVLARIILDDNDNQGVNGTKATITKEYNSDLINTAVERIINNDDKLIVVNMQDALIYPDSLTTLPAPGNRVGSTDIFYSLSSSLLHPYQTGYDKMANVWSNAILGYFNDTPLLINPLSASANQSVPVTLAWGITQNAVSYLVQIATDASFGMLIYNVGDGTITSRYLILDNSDPNVDLNKGGFKSSTTYYWRVRPLDGGNSTIGSYSDAWSFTTSPLYVDATVLLEGAYDDGTHLMRTDLNTTPIQTLPLNDPYGKGESVGSIPSPDIVDWVLVQLRTATEEGNPETATVVEAERAAFLKKDGTIVDLDGTSPVSFTGISFGDYYIVVEHRNHLAVMSNTPVTLSDYTLTYDFTTAQNKAYTTGPNPMADLGDGNFGMFTGDGNANGSITASDNNSVWLPQFLAGEDGYKSGDYNLNGSVTASDNNSAWLINFLLGADSQVP